VPTEAKSKQFQKKLPPESVKLNVCVFFCVCDRNDLCLESFGGPEKGRLGRLLLKCEHSLLGAGVLGDGLGSLRDGMLGELTWQEEPDSGLDFPGGDGGPLVVVGESAGLGGDALEQVVDERVHDAHGLGGDSGVGVHLLEDLVDVDGIGFLPFLVPLLLVSLGDGLGGLAGSLGSFS
jgi:hypothetical protein